MPRSYSFKGLAFNLNAELPFLNSSFEEEWCAMQGSNLRPLPCESNALPLS